MGFTIPNSADVPQTGAYGNGAMARQYSSDIGILEASGEGYYTVSGCDVVAGTNAGTLKVNTGTIEIGSPATEFILAAAIDNIACCSNADATNPRWAILELDSAGGAHLNLGTAAAAPVPPTLTATRTYQAAIFIPANATAVDVSLSTANGNAKIIDKRVIRRAPVRQIANTSSGTRTNTNPTSLTSLFTSLPTLAANSFNVGDVLTFDGAVIYTNTQNPSTIEVKAIVAGVTIMDWTTVSLATNANARPIPFQGRIVAQGAGVMDYSIKASVGAPGGGADADTFGNASSSIVVFPNSGALTFDIQVKVTTSSSTSSFVFKALVVKKLPVLT